MKQTHMTKLNKILEGKAKAQAKGVTRKGIAGFGLAIVKSQQEAHIAVWQRIKEALKQTKETLLLAIQEVEQERDKAVEQCKGERKEKKVASVRVSFARILTILRAYSKGENRDKIMGATGLPEMYAFASRKGTQRGKVSKPFDEEKFTAWAQQSKRIIGDQPGKKATDAERGKYDAQLARAEQALVVILNVLLKHEHLTTVPVKQMLALAQAKGKHIRVASARKAA